MEGSSNATVESIYETYGPVEELAFDDEFFEHMAQRDYEKHAVSEREVREVFGDAPVYAANAGPDRRALLVMLGETDSGRLLVAPIEPTGRRGVWSPVTAFEANAHHRERYREEQRQ